MEKTLSINPIGISFGDTLYHPGFGLGYAADAGRGEFDYNYKILVFFKASNRTENVFLTHCRNRPCAWMRGRIVCVGENLYSKEHGCGILVINPGDFFPHIHLADNTVLGTGSEPPPSDMASCKAKEHDTRTELQAMIMAAHEHIAYLERQNRILQEKINGN